MNTNFRIIPLHESPEFADVCAAWSFAEWGCHAPGRTLKETLLRFHSTAENPNDVYQTWVCLNENDQICGMASLEEKDHPEYRNLTPWLGSVYVHPEARGHGAVHLLCDAVENGAKIAGFNEIYLFTHTAPHIYAKRGWMDYASGKNPFETTENEDTIMRKKLN